MVDCSDKNQEKKPATAATNKPRAGVLVSAELCFSTIWPTFLHCRVRQFSSSVPWCSEKPAPSCPPGRRGSTALAHGATARAKIPAWLHARSRFSSTRQVSPWADCIAVTSPDRWSKATSPNEAGTNYAYKPTSHRPTGRAGAARRDTGAAPRRRGLWGTTPQPPPPRTAPPEAGSTPRARPPAGPGHHPARGHARWR